MSEAKSLSKQKIGKFIPIFNQNGFSLIVRDKIVSIASGTKLTKYLSKVKYKKLILLSGVLF